MKHSGGLSVSPAKIQKLIERLEAHVQTLAREPLHHITLLRELLETDIAPTQARLIYNEIFFRWKDSVRRELKKKEVDGARKVL